MSENYIPLYRKYRPQTLETLVGQEHIKKTLTSAIELGKISHAYLFTGPRGTGKTSTARILAKSLNCKNGPTVHPCGECESCKDITNSVPIDVIEIDAASNRKVEDAQNILEKVQYVPVNGKYKIYIIDEVHMLTNHAFNALLKTLEEPPANVIFILATTEVHKVLDTIKSRCQRFDFRRITTEDIVKHLKWISEQEKIKITDDALFAIAKNSAGGMRDSISLLDQLSILGISKEINIEDVNAVLGRVSFDILYKLSTETINSSPANAIEILNNIYNSGNEPLQILTNLNEYFKNLLVAKTCSKDLVPELTGLNEPQINELLKQTPLLEVHQIVFLIERVSYYIKEIKQAVNQHLWLEVCIIDLANMAENSKLLDLQKRISALESGVPAVERTNISQVVTRPAPIQPAKVEQASVKNTEQAVIEKASGQEEMFTPPPMAKKPDGNDINSLWQALLANISSQPTQAILKLATPVKISAEGVVITFTNEMNVSRINESNKKQFISESASVLFNKKDIPVSVKLASAVNTLNEVPKNSENTLDEDEKKSLINENDVEENISEKYENDTEAESGKTVEIPESNRNTANHTQTDQEKMILDLFDGKYVE